VPALVDERLAARAREALVCDDDVEVGRGRRLAAQHGACEEDDTRVRIPLTPDSSRRLDRLDSRLAHRCKSSDEMCEELASIHKSESKPLPSGLNLRLAVDTQTRDGRTPTRS